MLLSHGSDTGSIPVESTGLRRASSPHCFAVAGVDSRRVHRPTPGIVSALLRSRRSRFPSSPPLQALHALVAKSAKARDCKPRTPRCNSGRALHDNTGTSSPRGDAVLTNRLRRVRFPWSRPEPPRPTLGSVANAGFAADFYSAFTWVRFPPDPLALSRSSSLAARCLSVSYSGQVLPSLQRATRVRLPSRTLHHRYDLSFLGGTGWARPWL
jgi:hypothetical protein